MYKSKRILCLIPARGGSKGIPKKNIKLLSGKPLIAWTIEQALKSKYLDKILVSTDDEEIAEISKKYKAEVPFLRPKELAKDESPTSDTIIHAINWLENRNECFDILVLLEPTSPLRKEDDIDKALEEFIKNYALADSLISVGEVHMENPHIVKKIENGYVKPFMELNKNFHQRQSLPKVYFPYGVIYAVKTDSFNKKKTFYLDKTIPYFIERWQNYEIDDIYDFYCIETILNRKIMEKKK